MSSAKTTKNSGTMLLNRLTKYLVVRVRGSSSAARKKLPVPETPGNALREAFDAGSGEAAAATVPIPIDRLQRIESHVENLTQMMQILQARTGRPSRSVVVASRGSSATRGTAQPTPFNVSDLGLSRVSTSQSSEQGADYRYVNLASLTTLCDEVAELGDLLSNQARFLLHSAQDSPVETPGEPATERSSVSRPAQGPSGTQRSTVTRSTSEPTAATEATSGMDPVMDFEMNPPNIDWAYLDQVLRGNEDPDEGLGPSGERRP